MEGTVIIKHRKSGINYATGNFSCEYYNGACAEIVSAQHRTLAGKKNEVIVYHNKGAGNIVPLIKDVLQGEFITVKSSTAYANSKNKTLMKFEDSNTAENAATLINRMSGDTANPEYVNNQGYVTTNNGIRIRVAMTVDENGNKIPVSSTYSNQLNSKQTDDSDKTGGTSTDKSNWIVYGVIALFAIAIVLVILKKKKIIK